MPNLPTYCSGVAYNAHGRIEPCPIRDNCDRFKLKPSRTTDKYEFGPYDFEDNECGQFSKLR